VSIKVTASTMGRPSPASVRDDAGNGEDSYYRWRKMPGWVPNDPRCRNGAAQPREPGVPQPQNAKATAMRAERLRRYFAARDAGKSEAEAAAEAGVRETAGRAYEAEYQEQRQEDCDV